MASQVLPHKLASELLLTGDMWSARRLELAGFVNRVVPARQVMEAARELAGKIASKQPLALAAAKSALSDSAAQVRSQARQASKNTDIYVRDNPWQVVGIAALIGIVVGILASRRSD